MKTSELLHIIIAIVILSLVLSFSSIIQGDILNFGNAILFALILVIFNISAKELMARRLDSDVEHKIWYWSRFSLKPGGHLKKAIPLGIILPLIIAAFSVGTIKLMTLLTYNTYALKRRAARRWGHYSFTEMTDWHNALIGASGIAIMLLISLISYFFVYLEPLARLAAFYAFWNMIPFSKLDGMQILTGSKILYTILLTLTIVFATFALIVI